MKLLNKYILLLSSVVLLFACSSAPKQTTTTKTAPAVKPKVEPERYAVIYFEIYDRRECNGDITSFINDGEFFLLLECSSNTKEKIILPVNFSSEFKRDKGFLRTPIKMSSKDETIVINLLDEDKINENIVRLITKAESIGGMLIMTEKGFFLFKTALEYYSGKSWDKYINQDLLGLGNTQPCGSVVFRNYGNPPKSLSEAKYLEIKDGNTLKMKIKIYYSDK